MGGRGGRSVVAQPEGVSRFGRAKLRPPGRGSDGGGEGLVDLAGDVALEHAGDLTERLAFGGAPRDVALGAFVVGHAGEHDPVDRRVRLPVSASVEPVALGLAR